MNASSLSVPEGFEFLETAQGKVIRRKWMTWAVIPLLFFAIVWDSFLVFWYGAVLSSSGKVPWLFVVFPLGHVLVGVGITYFVISSFFNKTDILISPDEIRVLSHPLPWPGNKRISAAEIHDIKIRQRLQGRGGVRYALMYVDTANREKKFVSYIAHQEQAEFIAAQIRETLGMTVRS